MREKYLDEVFGQSDPRLAKLRAEMKQSDVDFMSLSGAEARVLQFLIRGFSLKKIAEFGTLLGYSALAMAQVLPTDGHLWTVEKDPERHARAMQAFVDQKNITAICGDARLALQEIAAQAPFDLVFIDANKSAYVDYLNWAETHVRPGGFIVGDNTFLWGAVWGDDPGRPVGKNQVNVMREFNRRLSDSARYNSVLIPTVDGLTVAQKLQ